MMMLKRKIKETKKTIRNVEKGTEIMKKQEKKKKNFRKKERKKKQRKEELNKEGNIYK
jgi:hypothetical protein